MKPYMTITACVLACALKTSAATIVVDPETSWTDTSADVTYYTYDINKSKDDTVQEKFLVTTGKDYELVTGYNDGDGESKTPGDNVNTIYDSSLAINDLATYEIGDAQYKAFFLSSNQTGKQEYFELQKLQVWVYNDPSVDSYDTLESNAELVYEYDTGDTLALYYNTGNSNWDISIVIPSALFVTAESNLDLTSTDVEPSSYVYLYTEYIDTGGFDTWAHGKDRTDTIPEPDVCIFLSLAAFTTIILRRKQS